MSEQVLTAENTLETRFAGILSPDTRKGYEGYLVPADKLVEVATALRDEFGYDYLSSVTGTDYLPEGKMEAVYHLYRSTGGSSLKDIIAIAETASIISPASTPGS